MAKKMIKCSNCGTFNEDKEYCGHCGNLISDQKKRTLREEKVKEQEIQEFIYKIENPGVAKRWMKHPNIFVKIIGWMLYSVISVVSLIGAGLAWIVAMAAAG
jgi:ribosomal protein L37E